MKDLHLKYHSETGSYPERTGICTDEGEWIDIPSDEYLEWIEDLADKHLKQQKTNTDANKITAKFEAIKLAFDNLKNEIGYIEQGDIIPDYQYNSLNESCDHLESEIYD